MHIKNKLSSHPHTVAQTAAFRVWTYTIKMAVYMHYHCFGQFHETSPRTKHFYLFNSFLTFFPEGCLGSFFFDLLHPLPKSTFIESLSTLDLFFLKV